MISKRACATDRAAEFFLDGAQGLAPAPLDGELYSHQEGAIRSVFGHEKNVVVATGTASGKTERFLYPILFDLYKQHLSGEFPESGIRVMIIYPMNALANNQPARLGDFCDALEKPVRTSYSRLDNIPAKRLRTSGTIGGAVWTRMLISGRAR